MNKKISKNRIFLPLLLGILFYAQVSAQRVDTLAFSNQESNFTGFLFTPAYSTAKLFPVVVVLHHASSGLHSDPIYLKVAEDLNSIDIAVFLYDRRGEGLSHSIDSVITYYELAHDAQAAIQKLKTVSVIDTTYIGLYGISQGCWIASIVNEFEKNIKFNILISPSTITPSHQMDYAASTNLSENGFDNKSIKHAISLRNIIDDFYRGKNSYSFTAKKRKRAERLTWFEHAYIFDLENEPEKSPWALNLDFDPMRTFTKIRSPTLVCYGEYDKWVPITQGIKDWKKIPIKDITIKRIENTGHFMIINEKSNPEKLKISRQYRDILRSWVYNHSKKYKMHKSE